MTSNNCLNCGEEVTNKFCSVCGQKTDTHRITFKNFIFHDVLHGTFHIEKGILFTAKQALLRPGKAALDYIAGKRISYYNVFYLILIVTGLLLFVRHFYAQLEGDLENVVETKKFVNEASRKFDELISEKSKLIIFLFVPFGALNSFLLFRRKKLNLSEHAILSGMLLLGILLISLFGHILFYLNLIVESDILSNIISYGTPALAIIYIIYGYYNAFSSDYSKLGITYRVFLFFGLLCLEIMILFLIVVGILTNWKFGHITALTLVFFWSTKKTELGTR